MDSNDSPRRLYAADRAGLGSITNIEELAANLKGFGILLVQDAEKADTLLALSVEAAIGPTVRLMPAAWPGRWRAAEENGGDRSRLQRLVRKHEPTLDEATVHAAFSGCFEPEKYAKDVLGVEAECRDLARRWIAVDALYNSAAADTPFLAGLIADCVFNLTAPTPSVSIVVNNYNYADFLGAAIESALDQTIPAREVIVVDDGSTDHSREVASRYQDVQTIFKPNGGQASAFNVGFASSEGDLILFLDADDKLRTDAVEVLSGEFWQHTSCLSFGLGLIDALGSQTGVFPISRTAASGELKGPLLNEGYLMMMPTSGMAFPRACLETLLPIPETNWRICADVYLAFGAVFLGQTHHIDRVLGDYRVHGNNAYYSPLGTEANFNERKVLHRRQAYLDIAKLLERDSSVDGRHDAARLNYMADPNSATVRKRLAKLDNLAIRRPLATPPLADGRVPDRPDAKIAAVLSATDPALRGGSATWNQVKPCERIDLTQRCEFKKFLGRGWCWLNGEGGELTGAIGTLALKLPGGPADWAIRFYHQPLTELVSITTWVNGTCLDPLQFGPAGETTLLVPANLLELDQTDNCRLDVNLVDSQPAKLKLLAIQADPIMPYGSGAPIVRVGDEHHLDNMFGYTMLGGGWDWPGDGKVAMSASEASLWLSLTEAGEFDLQLDIDPLPVLVSVEDAAVEVWQDAAGNGLHIPLGSGITAGTGKVRVTLFAGAERPILRAVRLLKSSGAHSLERPGYFVPVEEAPRRSLSDESFDLIVPSSVRRLVAKLTANKSGTSSITLAWRGQTLQCLGPSSVVLPSDNDVAGPLVVKSTDGLTIESLASDVPWQSNPDDASITHLTPHALFSRAEVATDWLLAGSEALWLACAKSTLLITVPDDGIQTLEVSALTVPETNQRLTLRCRETVVSTNGNGQQETVRLALQNVCEGDRLTVVVESDCLVSPQILSGEIGPPLGGALLNATFRWDEINPYSQDRFGN